MTDLWHSLYIQTDEPTRVVEALINTLTDYQRYDPFPGGSGTPPGFKTFIKLFIAPPVEGWCRVLGSLDADSVSKLSHQFRSVRIWLGEGEGAVEIYQDGVLSQPQAISSSAEPTAEKSDVQSLLPDDIQQLARTHGVDMKQADKMLNRLTAQVFGKLDRASGNSASQMQDQARGLISKSNRVNWNSPAGQQIRFIVKGLGLPQNWREPDFETLREAYQVARLLRKNPQARLLPDEQSASKAVPDAIHYEAVYLGK